MNPAIKNVIDVYNRFDKHLAKKTISAAPDKVNQLFASLYSPGPAFQIIFNFADRSGEYISDNLNEVIDLKPKNFTLENFLNCLHPDDLPHFKRCEEIAIDFFWNFLPPLELLYYKLSYQFRMRKPDGNYHLFLHQTLALTTSEEGQLSLVLHNHSDIQHITTQNNKALSFIGLDGRKSYYNITSIGNYDNQNKLQSLFTPREVEILRFLADGFSSKEIANMLHVSYDTIRTHRNNIIKKSGYKNMNQIIANCVREDVL